MDFINGIINLVQSTPIVYMDRSWYSKDISDAALRRMNDNPEYRVLMESFVTLYTDAVARGIPTHRAAAVVLSAHEDIVRATLATALKKKLALLGASDLSALNLAYADSNLQEKIGLSKDALDKIESKFKLYAENEKTSQFKYSLMYAAERWGSEDEKLAVNSLVTKIKDMPAAKK